jgi:hypothetical protein
MCAAIIRAGYALVLTFTAIDSANAQYEPGDPITSVSITNPTANEVWLVDTPHTLTCTTASDEDESGGEDVDDSVSHIWGASAGTFKFNDNVGTSVEYICPITQGNVTITVAADDDYAPEGNNPLFNENPSQDSEIVSIVGLTIHEVGFNNGHQLYRTPVNVWDDGTVAINNPIYDADDAAGERAAKNHACFTRGSTNTNLQGRCRTPVALTEAASFHLRADGTNTWNWGACSIAAGQTESSVVTCNLLGSLYGNVGAYTSESYTCAWRFICTNGANVERAVNTTGHNVYLTWGTPNPTGADCTVKRISHLCSVCNSASTAKAVADAIHGALTLTFGSSPTQSDDWPLMYGAPYRGECDEHARFMVRQLQLIGSTGTAYNTFASTDWAVTTMQSWSNGAQVWFLKFDFDGAADANGVHTDNNFEGSVNSAGHYYTVTPKLQATTEVRLLRKVGPDQYGALQWWVRTVGDDPYGAAIPGTEVGPVPYPPSD